jgi:hypothetical protein
MCLHAIKLGIQGAHFIYIYRILSDGKNVFRLRNLLCLEYSAGERALRAFLMDDIETAVNWRYCTNVNTNKLFFPAEEPSKAGSE